MQGKVDKVAHPMLVTYNTRGRRFLRQEDTIENRLAHPHLSMSNLGIAMALRLVQGKDGVYYCSNWTTPGNGHDLSLLSGFIVAHALGARYMFAEDAACLDDFIALRKVMGI